MLYPTGMLKNMATGRFHPISFRRAPMPGDGDSKMEAQRYKSLGHHTEGFDTLDEANAFIASKRSPEFTMVATGEAWEWDGVEMPIAISWYAESEIEKIAAAAMQPS